MTGQPYFMSSDEIASFADSRDLSEGERAALVENWGAILDNLRQMREEITPENIVNFWKKGEE